MNRMEEQKKVILENNLTDEELIKITGGETFVSIKDMSPKEPPIQALYSISPNPPVYPLYGIRPPVDIRPMYGVPVTK